MGKRTLVGWFESSCDARLNFSRSDRCKPSLIIVERGIFELSSARRRGFFDTASRSPSAHGALLLAPPDIYVLLRGRGNRGTSLCSGCPFLDSPFMDLRNGLALNLDRRSSYSKPKKRWCDCEAREDANPQEDDFDLFDEKVVGDGRQSRMGHRNQVGEREPGNGKNDGSEGGGAQYLRKAQEQGARVSFAFSLVAGACCVGT
jgi:hypothetical protein